MPIIPPMLVYSKVSMKVISKTYIATGKVAANFHEAEKIISNAFTIDR